MRCRRAGPSRGRTLGASVHVIRKSRVKCTERNGEGLPSLTYLLMDFALTDLQQSLHEEVLALAGSFGPEYWLEHDRAEQYPWEFVRAFARRGWLGTTIPEEYGGAGLGLTEAAGVLHALCPSRAGTRAPP